MRKTISGTICRLTDKGFGFIRTAGAAEDQPDFFFHSTALEDFSYEQLRLGQPVSFIPEVNATKGPRAARVRVMT